MLSVPRGLRLRAVADRRDEILDDAEMAADAVARIERRHRDRLDFVEEAVAHAWCVTSARTSSKPSQVSEPRSPTIRQPLSQLVRRPSAHQLPR